MSIDNYYVLRRHPKGGFALVQGCASVDDELIVSEEQESFPTMEAALKAYSDGQEWTDETFPYPRYYCEYGLSVSPECFQEVPVKEVDLADAICVNPNRIIAESMQK